MENLLDKIVNISRVLLVVIIIGALFENGEHSSFEQAENDYLAFEEEILEQEIEEEIYISEAELFSIELYFINNGYYYHEDKNCKGLEGYNNLNMVYYDELLDYPNLNACNWCVLNK